MSTEPLTARKELRALVSNFAHELAAEVADWGDEGEAELPITGGYDATGFRVTIHVRRSLGRRLRQAQKEVQLLLMRADRLVKEFDIVSQLVADFEFGECTVKRALRMLRKAGVICRSDVRPRGYWHPNRFKVMPL